MKQLIIGIDGGDEQHIRRLPMPYLNQLLDSQCCMKLTEDLLSRGWVEILSGKHARDTKAFYMVAQCDKTNDIKFKYSLSELLSNKEVKPIWQLPGGEKRVGMMNVPTTFPVPEVNGFFVSGAGGGVNKVDGIPPELCHPKEIAEQLLDMGYKIDLRFGTAGIKKIPELFERLCEMLSKRADAFEILSDKYDPEFGFVTFRAPTVIQYLAMSELESYFERNNGRNTAHESTEMWKNGIDRLYRVLDECIKKVVEKTNPEHWIITSDHGAVPYRYRLNIDRFLQDFGYQTYRTDALRSLKEFYRCTTRKLPFVTKRQVKPSQMTAFGHWYFTGIFVNDSQRFGGPVAPIEINQYVDRICEDFNSTQEAKQYDMTAKPYRSLHPNSKYNAHLPDVKIHCSDEIFFSKFHGPFVRENPDYCPLPSIANVRGGMHSGQKGRHPLFCCDSKTATLIEEKDPTDSTIGLHAYRTNILLLAKTWSTSS